MAEVKKEELTAMERGWVQQALKTQLNVLVRSRAKERAGSEIWVLRGREVDEVQALLNKFGG